MGREELTKSLPEGHKMTDVAKAAGQKWKALSEEAKKPFEAEYALKMEEYKKAMEKYEFVDPMESSEDESSQKSPNKRGPANLGTSPAVKRSRHSAPEAAATDAALLEEAERLKLDAIHG